MWNYGLIFCASLFGTVFSVEVPDRWKRQASGQLGSTCQQNTNCNGYLLFCSQGVCACTSSAIQFNNNCYQKISPGATGCLYDSQCNAVWPKSTCINSVCTCPVPYVPAKTRDVCPLPNIATNNIGALPALSAGNLATCTGSCGVLTGVAVTFPVNTNADIYDCVQAVAGQAGRCCPSRALTCSQPMLSGGTGGGEMRYYYNSVSKTCLQFNYNTGSPTAANTNSNNFETMDHCKSFCLDFCNRGNPQYNVSPETAGAIPATCSAQSSSCGTDFTCQRIGSEYSCCTKSDIICSLKGGRNTYTSVNSVSVGDPGFLGITNFVAETRYYFNPSAGSCVSFQYLGSGGNFNNFKSMTDCTQFCQQQLCVYGKPLLTPSGQAQPCTSSNDCPTSYECTSGTGTSGLTLCCPTKQTICAQPKSQGQCSFYSSKFWHNPATGQCELFQYSGCGGNDNNFEDYQTCMTACTGLGAEPKCVQGLPYKDTYGTYLACSSGTVGTATTCPINYECKYDGFIWGCCPIKTYTCSLTLDAGRTCGPATNKWYFDTSTQTCKTMVYYGCDGNPNNFPTKSLCEGYCGTGGCQNGGTVYLESGSSFPRVCSASVSCPAGYNCDPVTEAGNTQTKCCPTKAQVCQSSPSFGQSCGSGSTTRYFFNRLTRKCTEFSFQGCEIGGNNFGTLAQCNNFCGSAACLAGEIAFNDPNTNMAQTCVASVANSCPIGFTCRYDGLNMKSICCGGSGQGVCGASQRAYMDALTMEPRQCLPSNAQTCPSPFLCRLNTLTGIHYCCSSLDGSFCPAGNSPRFDSISRQPINCIVSLLQSTCPVGFSCQSTSPGAYNGFCCSAGPLCANNVPFDKDLAGNARMCTMNFPAGCRSGFTCQSKLSGASQGICCQGGGTGPVNGGCPNNEQAQTNGGQTVVCSPFGQSVGCTAPYTCKWSTINNKWQCCGLAGPTGSCPTNYQPYLANNQPVRCTSQANCPSNAQCLQNTVGQMQCCIFSQGTQCNVNQVSYQGQCLQKVTVGQSCVVTEQCLGNSLCLNQICNCPGGMQMINGVCQQGQSTTVLCSGSNQPAYINPNTRQPLLCQIGSSGVCPNQLICAQATNGQSVCCPQSQTNTYCNPGQTVITQNGQPLTCDNGQSFNCNPTGSACQYSASTRRFYCCRNGNTPTPNPNPGQLGCAFGSPLMYTYITPPAPLSCNLFPNNCPANYACQRSAVTSRNQCCPTSPVSNRRRAQRKVQAHTRK